MNVVHWTNNNNESQSKSIRQSSETLPLQKKRISKRLQKHIYDASFKELYKQQKLAEIVQKAIERNESQYEEYDEIKICGEIIKVNDKVIIKNEDSNVEDYIGSIQKICTVLEPSTLKLICICEVQWFMRKNEIICHKPRAQSWISNQEIFSTNTNDFVLAQTIIQKCSVVDCEEYFNMENCDSTTYFNRLEWDVEGKKFINMNTIKMYCLCQQPWNPELNYIQCDKCQKWYHFDCVGLKEGTYENKDFACGYCN